MTQTQALVTILIIAAATLLTRALPFWVFRGEVPAFVRYLGAVLPGAVIGMLVVYCFKGIAPLTWPHALPELLAGLFVVLAHHWKHNLALSIGGGTALYMLLVQVVFA